MGSTAIFLQAAPGLTGCGTLGLEDELAATVAHELLHGFGAVPQGAPHACPRDPGHICGDDRDVPQSTAQARPLSAYGLDPGRDDYYGHSGPWLDVQDSSWLQRLDVLDFALVVTPSAPWPARPSRAICRGSSARRRAPGRVGHPCQPDALADPSGPPLRRLAAAPGGRGACDLVLDAERRVEAGPQELLVVAHVAGRGRMTTTNFGCSTTCGKMFTVGRTLVFRARPAKGWRFVQRDRRLPRSRDAPGRRDGAPAGRRDVHPRLRLATAAAARRGPESPRLQS